mmetsp:Transcript_14656/g.21619  ORF Transcript_14656/g.21619 Transcript_14656/m.21619 type:complete len:222 (+) Transcript_14656:1716-2381(+)
MRLHSLELPFVNLSSFWSDVECLLKQAHKILRIRYDLVVRKIAARLTISSIHILFLRSLLFPTNMQLMISMWTTGLPIAYEVNPHKHSGHGPTVQDSCDTQSIFLRFVLVAFWQVWVICQVCLPTLIEISIFEPIVGNPLSSLKLLPLFPQAIRQDGAAFATERHPLFCLQIAIAIVQFLQPRQYIMARYATFATLALACFQGLHRCDPIVLEFAILPQTV